MMADNFITHAKLVGFSIRKDEIKRKKNNIVTSRRWVCAKEGFRTARKEDNLNCKREARPITRTGCKAAFRIRFDRRSNEWVIPPSCIMKRWLKTAKSDLSDKHESEISLDVISMARFSALSFSCSQMCFFGLRTKEGFEELKVEIARLKCRMEELYNSNINANGEGIPSRVGIKRNVRDLAIVKTKGDHGSTSNSSAKVRRCSNCRDVGHTRRTCPSSHIHQGEPHDSDNSHEFMEQPASDAPVGSPNLQTDYVGDI
ncbi:hypothetical protein SO802_023674 [Lithocarpus litseifolius]|uniref:FAR1 domain-containing protein n=1 Tax=Lithocarpus litseifolius TaxID=425828 RepID=A0AAW2C858_9ROSI